MEIVANVILMCVIVFLGFVLLRMMREIDKLIDRIMARNYETYIQAQELIKPARPLTPEEIAAMQDERGIPV
jgi:hypothetical protein